MDEYIKRDTVINHLDACMDTIWKPEIVALKCFVEGIPAADVAPVRHGRWVHDGQRARCGVDWWHCSNCGSLASGVEIKFRYCPHCGAKMDGAE